MVIFGSLGAAAVIVVALYIIPLIHSPVAAKPNPLRVAADNFFKIKVGENAPFFAEAKGGTGPYQYHWEFGDGAKSTDKVTTHVYAKEGIYTVVLTAIDSTGDMTTVAHDVDVYPPDANFTRGDDIMRR